ncbi:hypothetical protein MMC12_001020 [Toensbergia leucococca]|nr:hypothetical protein [Toensbergia leucococca]
MPTRSKKRKSSGQIYETVPNQHQAHFSSRNKFTSLRNPSLSTPKTRQPTLTQIDFVSYTPNQVEEDIDLGYEYEKVSQKTKRRKTMPAETRAHAAPSRRSKRRKVQQSIKAEEDPEEEIKPLAQDIFKTSRPKPNAPEVLMPPPPKTPRTTRKKEIPSSQSPPDTPFSAHRRRSVRTISRSPLKEKSANPHVRTPAHSNVKKRISWAPKLEVADSLGSTSGVSQLSGQVLAPYRLDSAIIESKIIPERASLGIIGIRGQRNKTEVCDSDGEFTDENAEDGAFDIGRKTQAVYSSMDIPSSSFDDQIYSALVKSESSSTDSLVSSNPADPATRPTHEIDNPATQPSKPDSLPNPSLSAHSPHIGSDSQEASAQLTRDLHRLTQPFLQDQDSQYDPTLQLFPPSLKDSIQEEEQPQNPTEDPSLPPPSSNPISQATTADLTQPTQPLPPPPLVLSSPRLERDSLVEEEWDGVRLTDSQLLPDSLMGDSLPMPPMLFFSSQESLEEVEN